MDNNKIKAKEQQAPVVNKSTLHNKVPRLLLPHLIN